MAEPMDWQRVQHDTEPVIKRDDGYVCSKCGRPVPPGRVVEVDHRHYCPSCDATRKR
jgi:DNA-directed RNA polymerase subunit RPC12/RpoP